MELTAVIGAMTFRLAATAFAKPLLAGARALVETEDGTVQVMDRGGRRFLLLDHRRDAEADEVARAELWLPLSCSEGGLNGAFVLCDPRPGCAGAATASGVDLFELLSS